MLVTCHWSLVTRHLLLVTGLWLLEIMVSGFKNWEVGILILRAGEPIPNELVDIPVVYWTNVLMGPFIFCFVCVMTLLYEKPTMTNTKLGWPLAMYRGMVFLLPC